MMDRNQTVCFLPPSAILGERNELNQTVCFLPFFLNKNRRSTFFSTPKNVRLRRQLALTCYLRDANVAN